MMQIHVFNTPSETIKALADFFIDTTNKAIKKNGECSVVLSGGNSPKELYELLITPVYKNKTDWTKFWFFFGDERYVPFTDKDNNGRMTKQALFDSLNIDTTKIVYINTGLSPDAAAADYEKKIITHFGDKPVHFDLILLGLGDNAHTASLFPHTNVLQEKKALMRAVYVDELNSYRITMTAPLINKAHEIAFLVYGAAKAGAVYHVLKGKKSIEDYPAQLIGAAGEPVHWFLDKAAAEGITDLF
jgi:6-phosphogluconolactonase